MRQIIRTLIALLSFACFHSVSSYAQQWEQQCDSMFSAGIAENVSFSSFAVAYSDPVNSNGITVMKKCDVSPVWTVVGSPNFNNEPGVDIKIENKLINEFYVGYRQFNQINNQVKLKFFKENMTPWTDVFTSTDPGSRTVFAMARDYNWFEVVVAYDVGSSLVVKRIISSSSTISAGSIPFLSNPDIEVVSGGQYIICGTNPVTRDIQAYRYNGSSWVLLGAPIHSGEVVTIQNNQMVESYLDMALDASGTPYIAYRDSANGHGITVRAFDGTNWNLVGSANISGGMAANPLLKIINGAPVLVYSQSGGPPYYWYAYRFIQGSWYVLSGPNPHTLNRRDVGLTDNLSLPYVVYLDPTQLKLNCKRFICGSSFISANGSSTSANFCTGDSLNIAVSFGPGLFYQWKRNGNIIPGATASTYYASVAGTYSCDVTKLCGTTTTNNLIVNMVTPAVSISAGGSTTICTGGSLNLSASAGTGYQWTRNGSNIPGATASTRFGCFK